MWVEVNPCRARKTTSEVELPWFVQILLVSQPTKEDPRASMSSQVTGVKTVLFDNLLFSSNGIVST